MLTKNRKRRGIGLAAAVLTTAALLTACGGSDDNGGRDGNSPSAGDPGSRTITGTYLGDVTVPEDPQRVISGWLVGSQLVDLGITPVGMLDEFSPANASAEELAAVKDVPTVGSIQSGINVEETLALNPDMVITMVREDTVDKTGIRDFDEVGIPTVAFEIHEPVDVWGLYQKVADAVGKGEEAKERLEGLDEQLRAIATDDAEAISQLGTVAYIEGSQEPATYQIATNKSLVYERLAAAGLKYFDGVSQDPERYNEQVSVEDLGRLRSANVLFFEADAEGNPTARTQALLDSPAFQALPVVQEGNLFPYRTPYSYTASALQRQIEDIEAAIAEAKPAE